MGRARATTALGRLNDAIEATQIRLATLLLVAFVGCVTLEVTSRYALGQSFIWSQETATLLFIWSVFVAAPVGFRHDSHLQLALFGFVEGTAPARLHARLVDLINLAFALAYGGLAIGVLGAGLGRVNAATGLPLEIGWAAIVVFAATAALYVVERLVAGTPLGQSARPGPAGG
jgi:TRAP-type C4-dicarboxylate transport system permease small subunit